MFELTTTLPVTSSEIDRVTKEFARESSRRKKFTCDVDEIGLANQTRDNIAAILTFQPKDRFFWLYQVNGRALAYAMTHLSKDVDNSRCYYMTQAWVDKELRNKPIVKQMYQQLRQHAQNLLCRHIIVVSSRGAKGYCRFLGRNWQPYVTLLKETLP